MIGLETAFSWLNQFDNIQISPSSGYLLQKIDECLEKGAETQAGNHLRQLLNLCTLLQDANEVMEVRIVCGDIAYKLKDLAQAMTILEDALTRAWPDLHRRAVVQWMIGCLRWETNNQAEAVNAWRNSLQDFNRMARKPTIAPETHQWYEQTCRNLEQSLIEALESGSNPAGNGNPPDAAAKSSTDQNATQANGT